MDDTEVYCIFTGRVQGVGFRFTTQSIANKRGLKGFVRNLSDGTVELCAQGDKNVLESLINELQLEFPQSHIGSILYRSPSETFNKFLVLLNSDNR